MSMQPATPRKPREEPKVDSMPWWYAGVAILETVVLALGGQRWQQLAFVAAFALLLVPSHDIYKPRYSDRAFVNGIILAFAAWSPTMFAWVGPVRGFFVYVGLLAWMCTGIGFFHTAAFLTKVRWKWLRDKGLHFQEIREENEFELVRRVAIPALFRQVDHPNARNKRSMRKRLIRRVWTSRGWQWSISVIPWAASELEKHSGDIAVLLGLRKEQVVIRRSDDAEGVAVTNINFIDTLETIDVWKPTPEASIAEPVAIGRDEDRRPVYVNLVNGHGGVVGATKSGKSRLLLVIADKVAASPDALLWIMEITKKGQDFMMFKPHCQVFATHIDDYVDPITGALVRGVRYQLHQLERIAEARYSLRASRNESEDWVPCEPGGFGDGPQIVVIIDEASAIANDKQCLEAMRRLAIGCRAAGIMLRFGLQRPDHRVFDTITKEQADSWQILACSKATVRMVNEDTDRTPAWLLEREKGLGYQVEAGEPDMPKFRTWNVDLAGMARHARSLAPYKGWDAPDGAPTDGPGLPVTSEVKHQVAGVSDRSSSGEVKLTENGRKILGWLEDEPQPRAALVTLSGVGFSQTKDALDLLVRVGFAVQHGDGSRGTTWSVTELGRAHLERQEVRA